MNQAFIKLKDHKDNFINSPRCRLINPAKSDIGRISKQIFEKINKNVRETSKYHQWRNTSVVIDWDIPDKNIPDKDNHTFTQFDIENFYPSISEDLLQKALSYAKTQVYIPNDHLEIIFHPRKSLLFDKNIPWINKNNDSMLDVTMGSNDGAEVCELVGLYILSILSRKYQKRDIDLYRDDGLAIFKPMPGPKMERIKKGIIVKFKKLNLKIVIDSNMKIVKFLDVTLNIFDGSFSPYRKPNDESLYINSMLSHPPNIIKHLPKSTNRRISSLSCNEEHFNNVKRYYEDQLKSCGYNEPFSFMNEAPANNRNKTRKRNILWFNPRYSQSVKSNVGKIFLKLVRSHFPKTHRFHKIFNKNNVKVSYSCMNNLAQIIKSHNSKILNNNNIINENPGCNCRRKAECPLDNQCLSCSLVYKASVIPFQLYLLINSSIFDVLSGCFLICL